MDPQTAEALQERVATLERRLLLAVVGLLFVTVSFVVSMLAQPNFVRAAGDEVTRADLKKIQSQANELRSELRALYVRVTAIEEELVALKSTTRYLKTVTAGAAVLLAAAAGATVTYFLAGRPVGVTFWLAWVFRLVVFISEAYFAAGAAVETLALCPLCPGSYIGLAFGIVILVWRARSVREAVHFRSLAFLAASAFIWILTLLIGRSINGYGAIVLGTVLLTVAHAQLLGTSWTRTLIAIPGILGIWLPVWLVGFGIIWQATPHLNVGLAVWQAAYILFMFGSTPKFLRGKQRSAPDLLR